MFKKYLHVERLETSETANIEFGVCYVFPKIDGTNSSVWLEGDTINCGSRTRHLTLETDNAGFMNWAVQQGNLRGYLLQKPTHRLFGEWLVPHSLKTYNKNSWRKFYVFDVAIDEDGEAMKFLSYDVYKPLLEAHGIEYIPPICTILNGTKEQFYSQLAKNIYLIEDGLGAGEGLVIKNYTFKNKYGRNAYAKIVTSEFKEKHIKTMGHPEMNGQKAVEEEIAREYCTTALIEKEYAKIVVESDGWQSKFIPRLLNTVYYSIVKEDCWEFVKKHKNPTIDFKRLNQFITMEIKSKKSELF